MHCPLEHVNWLDEHPAHKEENSTYLPSYMHHKLIDFVLYSIMRIYLLTSYDNCFDSSVFDLML